ncbi:uncharacterized protein At1g03900 [Eucalyptus grandis]|uniref:uncharacterized protein At1g03900 n=1 Tax=Eucalyptus grandis TaxID=71139 RepID=UPI00192E92CB|nr:uncharacterized protein At1g03900 [Eucalyptus grandis]
MEKEESRSKDQQSPEDADEAEPIELVLFQVSECYVYLIPPRKSAASYRADEWDVNKWAWEGALKVISKGEECIIKLEDKITGDLYARAFLRNGEPHPVEAVIDSSRYFVLRIEENIGGRMRHAFIGIGFRERTEAYDFQAALHDHMKYLDKKKTAEEMEQQYQHKSSGDFSLKEGETLKLQLKNKSSSSLKSKHLEQSLNSLSLEKANKEEPVVCLKPPPPPPAPLSPVTSGCESTEDVPPHSSSRQLPEHKALSSNKEELGQSNSNDDQSAQEVPDDDFGDFQTAG